jgi:hypothetical protein
MIRDSISSRAPTGEEDFVWVGTGNLLGGWRQRGVGREGRAPLLKNGDEPPERLLSGLMDEEWLRTT